MKKITDRIVAGEAAPEDDRRRSRTSPTNRRQDDLRLWRSLLVADAESSSRSSATNCSRKRIRNSATNSGTRNPNSLRRA